MTLDEAINHYEEMAEKQEQMARGIDGVACKERVVEYKQLAEWLRELVAYRKVRMCGNCRHYVRGTTHFGECHVTSDIEPCVVSVNQIACDTFFDYADIEVLK